VSDTAEAGLAAQSKSATEAMMSQPPVSPTSITVCMPAYNEEAVIADTVYDCAKTLAELPGQHTILVVNDGSTDRTGEILADLARQLPQLRILVHPENRGIAHAQSWLIREAEGELIFHIAADGEWRASELHGLLGKLNEGYDIVIGVRRRKHYSWYRKMVSWVYNMLVVVLFGKNLRDIGSIKLARARLWKRIPAEANSAFFLAKKLLLAYRNGARIGFTSVEHVWRSTGRSKFNNPMRALEAFVELLSFWLSPQSRQKIDLYSDDADPQVTVRGYQGRVKLPSRGSRDQRWGRPEP
jgi:glycosyltransferase involved in cell wall biosynthesis